MTISPWAIYLILQLDSIKSMLGMCQLILGFAILAVFTVGAFGTDLFNRQTDEEKECWKGAKRVGFRLVWAFLFCATAGTLLPSTRSMAAIVVLPAIVNNETVQKEAGELYQLAKQGLEKAVKGAEPATPAE